MKPYMFKSKYYNVYEIKGDNTVGSNKSKRQESKKLIRDELQNLQELIEDAWDDFCNDEGI